MRTVTLALTLVLLTVGFVAAAPTASAGPYCQYMFGQNPPKACLVAEDGVHCFVFTAPAYWVQQCP